MAAPDVVKPPRTTSIDAIKRIVYLAGLPIGASVSTLVWFLEREGDVLHVVDRIGLPILAIEFALLALLIWRRSIRLRLAELILFASFGGFMLISMSFTLFLPHPPGVDVGDLAGAGYWFPVIYVMAFLMFGARLGRALALGLFAISLLLGLARIVTGDPEAVRNELLIISQIYTANGLLLLLISSVAAITRLQTEHALAMEHAANTDPLTGLENRRRLERLIEAEINRTSRYGKGFSVILFDLDHFKQVNDRFGHQVGDAVLCEIGKLLPFHIRQADTIGRWGGEEFLILTPEMIGEAAQQLAERLRSELERHGFPVVGRLTASFGVAEYHPGDTIETLFQRADDAMYQAKHNGRNTVMLG